MMMIATDPRTGRLPVQVVLRLHRLLGGEQRVEQQILDYIAGRWKARTLFYLPPHIAEAVIDRPYDFIRAAKNHNQPELGI
jgi:hypothetical protein